MKPHLKDYMDLGVSMVRTGVLGYGGGPSVIPLIRHDAVKRYQWLGDEEFGEILAIANALPGPIATKMAAYLGYKRRGILGASYAVIMHILPSVLAMLLLLSAVNLLAGSRVVKGMIAAVSPVIAVMLGVMAYEFAKKGIKGLGIIAGILFMLLALLLLEILEVHPALVIVLFLGYGAVHFRAIARFRNKRKRPDREGDHL
ncbi:chromate transporter [Paenibacillus barengoltzii J12]|uniref:Chromate transporter n=2 Tax=Paenibacillus TaxID=44249 RepID=A0ABY1LU88_9BACL|nr:chromate transporter [Paenibacillus barengoltzii J12]SMF09821.1 chromate transporter [Paenibacillus barengoltzii]